MLTVEECRSGIKQLIEYLGSRKAGPISNTLKLEALLSYCWDEFENNEQESMTGDKLHDRMEEVNWEPPILTFLIERHGITALGSTRAEVHTWEVDISTCAVSITQSKLRQVRPLAPRLNTKPLADEIAQLILKHDIDERIKWYDDGSVRVLIGKIIPGIVPMQTLLGRRKRFRNDLIKAIQDFGWETIKLYVYAKKVQ